MLYIIYRYKTYKCVRVPIHLQWSKITRCLSLYIMPLIHTSPSHIPTLATGITGHLAVWHALRGQDRFFGALQGQWRPTRKPRCQVLHVALGKDRKRWAWRMGVEKEMKLSLFWRNERSCFVSWLRSFSWGNGCFLGN